MERRSHKPGQHGQNLRRKTSDFGLQLAEKQKIQFNYGLRERPLSRLVKEARTSDIAAGDKLIETTLRVANGRLTCAEALGHKEFVMTKLYRSA